ncbi:MAG: hypothetical protein ACR2IE_10980 [Candidatus Sumerlaeaceae bacterium]
MKPRHGRSGFDPEQDGIATPAGTAAQRLPLHILPQPDDTTCGPTCLQAVYNFFEDAMTLEQVLAQIPCLPTGGTLTSILARHALKRGYRATLHTYNLQVFDPTWFELAPAELARRLRARSRYKRAAKQLIATKHYLKFLEEGGQFAFEDLTTGLIRRYVEDRGIPILTGLSATYLYRTPREYGPNADFDDLRGDPAGHFVVLYGYNHATREVLVADPLYPNPFAKTHHYLLNIDRVLCSILLGTLTYDANLLIIEPARNSPSPGTPLA